MVVQSFPQQLTPFVGRESEIAELGALLTNPDCRLLSLIGPGGMGKTRLAIEVAYANREAFPDGVYFVGLQSLGSADGVGAAIAQALNFRYSGDPASSAVLGVDGAVGRNSEEQLLDYLHAKQLLLVIDNFEHVLEGAKFIAKVLEHAPHITMLVTSREMLNLQVEWVRRIPGLPVPNGDEHRSPDEYDALRLFIERARRVRGDFDVEAELPAITAICRLVGGMPLAIELAAGWLKTLTCAEIVQEIQRSADILATTARDIPERHRSIRAVFHHSWAMLSPDERQTLMSIAVFRSGATREAIQTVTGTSLMTLTALVEKSLITSTAGRYHMHDLLRQYAEEQLEAEGEPERLRAKHSQYFLAYVATREADIEGRRQIEALDEIEADFENIRTAWRYAADHRRFEPVGDAAEALALYMWMRGRPDELRDLMLHADATLAPAEGEDPHPAWVRVLVRGAQWHAEPLRQLDLAQEFALARNDREELALIYYIRAVNTSDSDGYERIIAAFETSLAHYEAVDKPFKLGEVLLHLGSTYYDMGQYDRFLDCVQQAIEFQSGNNDYFHLSASYAAIAENLFRQGRFEDAEAYLWKSRHLGEKVGWSYSTIYTTIQLGTVIVLGMHGDTEQAQTLLEEGHTMAQGYGWVGNVAVAKMGLSLLESLNENYKQAQQYGRQAHDTLAALDMKWVETWVMRTYWPLALAACGQGNMEAARDHSLPFLQYYAEQGFDTWMLAGLPVVAAIAAHEGAPRLAVEALALAFTHPRSMTGWVKAWPLITRLQDRLHAELGTEGYDRAWEQGAASDLETLVQRVLQHFEGDTQDAAHDGESLSATILEANAALVEPLSERELEVLILIARGHSNREIGEQLFIGVSTVKKHITHIYGKLAVESRTQALVRAQELNLIPPPSTP